jgi:hypothetical protein
MRPRFVRCFARSYYSAHLYNKIFQSENCVHSKRGCITPEVHRKVQPANGRPMWEQAVSDVGGKRTC